MRPLLLILIIFLCPQSPVFAQIRGRCVRPICADGYDKCPCDDGGACCRNRMMKKQGRSGGTSQPSEPNFMQQGMQMMQKNMQMRQQQEQHDSQLQKEGDKAVSQQMLQQQQQLDSYHQNQNQSRVKKNKQAAESAKQELRGLEEGFRPLKIEDSIHQMKYVKENDEKHGKNKTKNPKSDPPSKTGSKKSQAENSRPPKRCKKSTPEFPNQCLSGACSDVLGEMVCCPKGFPYLNYCTCQCYETTDFDCNDYSPCQHYMTTP